jgi:AmmeMemoRadiSam system protein B
MVSTQLVLLVGQVFFFLLAASGVQAQQQPAIPSMYSGREPFLAAIDRERPKQAPHIKVTGITVPHHLLAADLIARGFWAALGNTYDRVILVSPDHYNKSRKPLGTTRQDMETPFGTLHNDLEATASLLADRRLFDESDLFKREHGIGALLPFIKHFFPDARIVPITVSYASTRSDWDAAVAALHNLVGPATLIVQSTDYSHYLTHQVAVRRDQETLNIIAAEDIDAVARLVQPDHMDSKGSQYLQMRLQTITKQSAPIVIANRSSREYSALGDKTTSYIVTVYSPDSHSGAKLRYDDQEVIYFGGDTFVGRWLAQPMAKPEVADHVIERIRAMTGGAPLIVNLEGVLLDDPPPGINPSLHFMDASLAIPILKQLNVVAAGLANNHSHDLGDNGFRQSAQILKRSDIKPLRHMQVVDLGRGGVGVVAVNFIGVRDYKGYPVIKSVTQLEGLCEMKAPSPLIAFVHWGTEYTRAAKPNDYLMAQSLHNCGANAIIGAHSHQAAARIEAMQGGEYQLTFSLGNFLFDQKSNRASSALLELRLFKQGTFATRLIPLPNMYELAVARSVREIMQPVSQEESK